MLSRTVADGVGKPRRAVFRLDVGTQGTKALLYDNDTHTVIAIGSSSYGLIPSEVPARAQQHPDTWLEVDTSRFAESISRKTYDVGTIYLNYCCMRWPACPRGHPPGYCAGLRAGAGRWPPCVSRCWRCQASNTAWCILTNMARQVQQAILPLIRVDQWLAAGSFKSPACVTALARRCSAGSKGSTTRHRTAQHALTQRAPNKAPLERVAGAAACQAEARELSDAFLGGPW